MLCLLLGICIGALQSGCMGACDILDHDTKELSGDYCLGYTSEFNEYVVESCGRRSHLGIFDGSVSRLGWTDRYIVAWRVARIATIAAGGVQPAVKAGWMVLDVREKTIDGPLSEPAFADLKARRPALADVVIHEVSEMLP